MSIYGDNIMNDEIIKTDFFLVLPSEVDTPIILSDFYKQDYIASVDENGNETQIADGNPYLVQYTNDYAIDIIGELYKPTGNILQDIDGNDYPEVTLQPGWHVNVRILTDKYRNIIENINTIYGVLPRTPSRIFL